MPLYHQILHIIICDDVEKELSEIRKKFYVTTDQFESAGYAESEGKHHLIILNMKYLTDELFTIGTIAHEAFHITNFMMKRVGIKPDIENDEPQAYLLSLIVEHVYKQYKKYTG